ncbi:hypothetical protein ZWY2020_003688 [Hordeum vulgare]|nr:hypothetical protein ZWY2020_003688 [Hordeum vulgare]
MVVKEGSFKKQVESLGRVKHINLTILHVYYVGSPLDVRLLVYDYMPNGNLATLLEEASHQDGHILNSPNSCGVGEAEARELHLNNAAVDTRRACHVVGAEGEEAS